MKDSKLGITTETTGVALNLLHHEIVPKNSISWQCTSVWMTHKWRSCFPRCCQACVLLIILANWHCRLWPTGSFQLPWRILVESLYKNLANKDVCWTKARGGCWLAPNELIFPDTHTARNSGLMEALVAIQIPLCTMPNDIATMLLAFTVSVMNQTMLEHSLGDNASGCRAMSIALIGQDFFCCICGILTASHIMGFFSPLWHTSWFGSPFHLNPMGSSYMETCTSCPEQWKNLMFSWVQQQGCHSNAWTVEKPPHMSLTCWCECGDFVLPPPKILNLLKVDEPKLVNPALVRQHIRETSGMAQLLAGKRGIQPLLQYCAMDIDDGNPKSVLQLAGLPLLPLLNGQTGSIQLSRGKRIFLPTHLECQLLCDHGDVLIDIDILGQDLWEQLNRFAGACLLNVHRINVQTMADAFFPRVFPARWRGQVEVVCSQRSAGEPTW